MHYQRLVDAATVVNELSNPRWVIFDCRFALKAPEQGRSEYDSGHLPGAHYADLDVDLASGKRPDSGRHPLPDVARFTEWLRQNGVDSDSQVVAYDGSAGMFAARLWWLLRWLGDRNVAVLDGGWQAWLAAGYAVSTQVPSPRRGNFVGQADDSMWVSTREVAAIAATQGEWTVVDARAGPRFDGEHEPIDPVAGHIPGAVNYPCSSNVDDRGRFLGPEEIRSQLAAVIPGACPDKLINMCGSGVTACRNILAMELAGWTGSKLYVGSWSEWITDPGRPIAVR